MGIEKMLKNIPKGDLEKAKEYKRRLLNYENPVEFVNNMYGCHPDDKGGTYFQRIYG